MIGSFLSGIIIQALFFSSDWYLSCCPINGKEERYGTLRENNEDICSHSGEFNRNGRKTIAGRDKERREEA